MWCTMAASLSGSRGPRRRVPGVPAPQSSDPETERFLLFSAVVGLLAEFGGIGAGVRGAG